MWWFFYCSRLNDRLADPSTFSKISKVCQCCPCWWRSFFKTGRAFISFCLSLPPLRAGVLPPSPRCYFWEAVMKLNVTSRLARWQAVNFQPNSGWQIRQTTTSPLNLLKNIHYFDGTVTGIKRHSPDALVLFVLAFDQNLNRHRLHIQVTIRRSWFRQMKDVFWIGFQFCPLKNIVYWCVWKGK